MLEQSTNPARRSDLTIEPPNEGRRVVFSQRDGRYYRLGVREAAFLESLTGDRTLQQLRAAPPDGLTGEQVERIVAWLGAQGLLESSEVAAPVVSPRRRLGRALIDSILRPGSLRIPLVRPDGLLERNLPLIHRLCSIPALFVYLIVLASPMAVATLAPEQVMRFAFSIDPSSSAGGWVALYASILVTIAIHELAHAIACKHFGARVHRIGVMLFYLNPVAYCDISDSWRLPDRRQKVWIAAAGMFAQAVLAAAALSGWMLTGQDGLLHYSVINAGLIAFNLIPFVKLDGYWILVHLLDEPNLRLKALAAVDHRLRCWLGRPVAGREQAHAPMLAFGLAHLVAVPIFLSLGVLAIYRIGAWFSEPAGFVLAGVVTLGLLYRAARIAVVYTAALGRREVRGGV